nr:uncharacterized protein LOC109193052 [Ipomoea batatas]
MGQTCGITSGKLLGVVPVAVDLNGAQSKPVVFQSRWKKLGGGGGGADNKPMLHVVVRFEPNPRFVFPFSGEPECSPVVFQIQGNIRQLEKNGKVTHKLGVAEAEGRVVPMLGSRPAVGDGPHGAPNRVAVTVYADSRQAGSRSLTASPRRRNSEGRRLAVVGCWLAAVGPRRSSQGRRLAAVGLRRLSSVAAVSAVPHEQSSDEGVSKCGLGI